MAFVAGHNRRAFIAQAGEMISSQAATMRLASRCFVISPQVDLAAHHVGTKMKFSWAGLVEGAEEASFRDTEG